MIDVQMPQLGESVAEGTVTQWHVKVGDAVSREQPLLEVATDKADSEVPSPGDGVVTEILVAEGDVVPTGGLLCKIDENATAAATPNPPPGPETPSAGGNDDGARALASPSSRKLAREQGVDLNTVQGTGDRGRITHDDIQRAAAGPAAARPDPGRSEAARPGAGRPAVAPASPAPPAPGPAPIGRT
ncbi:MAG: biotin/lipoyl-containing protein, partial [Myxococcota bacterium]